MADDIRYEVLLGRYNAVVAERDQLLKQLEARTAPVPTEMMALVCDNHVQCGKAIVGLDEESIRVEAKKRKWFMTPPGATIRKDYCPDCHRTLQTPL